MINQYCKFKLHNEINAMLTRCGELKEFAKSCFEHFMRFDLDVFLLQLVHNLIFKEIVVEGSRQFEIRFGIG